MQAASASEYQRWSCTFEIEMVPPRQRPDKQVKHNDPDSDTDPDPDCWQFQPGVGLHLPCHDET